MRRIICTKVPSSRKHRVLASKTIDSDRELRNIVEKLAETITVDENTTMYDVDAMMDRALDNAGYEITEDQFDTLSDWIHDGELDHLFRYRG